MEKGIEPVQESVSLESSVLRSKTASLLSVVSPDYLALIACCFFAAGLIVFFVLMVKPLVFLRADILMWEETDFVGNIIKMNIGEPIYTAPSDSNSLIYNPLAFLVTYAIAWPTGLTKSVGGLRAIQLLYVGLAALVATYTTRRLSRFAFPDRETRYARIWTVLTFFAMLLIATSPNVNRFVYTLHVDALSLLVSVVSFWAMLYYAEKRSLGSLLIMAVCPAIGFLTKQFLISWIGVMLVFLVVLDPKNLKRLVLFVVLSCGLALIAFASCYALWGENFLFWTVEIMGGERKAIVFSPDSHSISLVRSLDHIIRAWPEIFVGIIGTWFLLRLGNSKNVAPLIVAWIVLLASEGVSSGAGWSVLYHFGPGAMIGAVFLFSALPEIWKRFAREAAAKPQFLRPWINASFLMASVVAIFMAWHVVPTGDKNSPRYIRGISDLKDVDRYVAEIENEFEGVNAEKVLLGVGSWIYLRDDVLQKDRAVALSDQPLGGIYENFDITVGRLRNRTYEKILVQDFHSPYFLYDWSNWPKPSGFRDALSENYVEIKLIEAPKGSPTLPLQILNAGPVSVFVRRG